MWTLATKANLDQFGMLNRWCIFMTLSKQKDRASKCSLETIKFVFLLAALSFYPFYCHNSELVQLQIKHGICVIWITCPALHSSWWQGRWSIQSRSQPQPPDTTGIGRHHGTAWSQWVWDKGWSAPAGLWLCWNLGEEERFWVKNCTLVSIGDVFPKNVNCDFSHASVLYKTFCFTVLQFLCKRTFPQIKTTF